MTENVNSNLSTATNQSKRWSASRVVRSLSSALRFVAMAMAGVAFAVATFATVESRPFMAVIGELHEGLPTIAKFVEANGRVDRKTIQESLWFPVGPSIAVYDGDLVATGQDSTAVVEFPGALVVRVSPETLLRVRVYDGVPLFRLSRGQIELDSAGDRDVYVQNGSKLDKLSLAKGKYELKNQMTGLVSLTAVVEKVVRKKRTKSSPNAKPPPPGSPEVDDSDPTLAEDEEEEAPEWPPKTTIVYDLPFPRDGTIFLVRSLRALNVAAEHACPDSCEIRIDHDGRKNWRVIMFKKGQEPVLRLERQDLSFGNYQWSYSTDSTEYKASFVIKPFSDENFSSAITSGKNIEMM